MKIFFFFFEKKGHKVAHIIFYNIYFFFKKKILKLKVNLKFYKKVKGINVTFNV